MCLVNDQKPWEHLNCGFSYDWQENLSGLWTTCYLGEARMKSRDLKQKGSTLSLSASFCDWQLFCHQPQKATLLNSQSYSLPLCPTAPRCDWTEVRRLLSWVPGLMPRPTAAPWLPRQRCQHQENKGVTIGLHLSFPSEIPRTQRGQAEIGLNSKGWRGVAGSRSGSLA